MTPRSDPALQSLTADTVLATEASGVVPPGSPIRWLSRDDVARLELDDAAPFSQRYGVEGRGLGVGGMGMVRACADRRTGRDVAVKTLRPDREASPEAIVRFLREACVQAQLEHPSIVPVYDLGRSPDRELYFTMKRVNGETLRDVLVRLRDKEPAATAIFTRRKLLTAFVSVCHAVHYAHTRGVIHRDLKPLNVMLGPFGEVYVLDWGIARVLSFAEPASEPALQPYEDTGERMTSEGRSLGTIGYMAPEQARDAASADVRSDVFGLGAILFEVLTLERLVPLAEREARLGYVTNGVEARGSIRAPDAQVPPELEEACVVATALDPSKRFATARALGDAVERFLDGDRDLERRRELSQFHVDAARQALGEGGESRFSRPMALRELGLSLALDPENVEAAGMLVRALTSLPRDVPKEVVRRIHDQRAKSRVVAVRGIGFAMLGWMTTAPLVAWMGVRSPSWCIVMYAFTLATIVLAWFGARRPSGTGLHVPTLLTSFATLSSLSGFFGPLLYMPAALIVGLAIAMTFAERKDMRILIPVTLAAFLAPLLLEWTGVLPPSYAMNDGALVLLPRLAWFPARQTLAVLVFTNLLGIGITLVYTSRLRRELLGAEETLQLRVWQLEQLVPVKPSRG
jgi:eukaryotic-like serine/threonine-protein kinase